MPRYHVVEYHTYTLTFEVEAANEEDAKALANAMSVDEADEEELGLEDTEVFELA
jgi:hypothetical protein